MITLYQFPATWGLPNGSPFCWKVENYLRMAGLPYQTKLGDPRKAPKGKLPTINDDGTVIADSGAIIEHLKKRHGDKLDDKLTERQRATGHAITRLLEESLYWPMIYARWIEDDGFALVRDELLRPAMPPIVREIVPGLIRSQIKKQLHAQGTGRHTRAEIYEIGRRDLDALAAMVGDQPYMLGGEPTSIDATAYAFVGVALWSPPGSPLKQHVEAHPSLVAYCERMRDRYWGQQPKS
jgi:glutathione S-transferase